MDVESLEIEAVKLIRPRRFTDNRGYFTETWNRQTFAAAGVDLDFVQDNSSWSERAGTVRALHFQRAPREQAKLIRAVRGSIFDVAVDLRPKSAHYGRYVSAVLTAEKGEQLFIPAGFAHGFCTLEDATEVAYKASDYYSPEHDAGIRWDDPDVRVTWPLGEREPIVSEKDRRLPRFADLAISHEAPRATATD